MWFLVEPWRIIRYGSIRLKVLKSTGDPMLFCFEWSIEQRQMDREHFHTPLTEGNILKGILSFALPLLVGQIFQLFYSLVDVRIVGEILGEHSLASVGATTTLSDLLIGLLNGFTNGLAIVIATFYGAGDEKHLKKALGGTIFFGVLGSLMITVISILTLPAILNFLNVQDNLVREAGQYIRVILAGLICTAFYNICAAILRAVGDSFTPLLFLILASVGNIGLDYLFIGAWGFGVAGAAYATVISQAVSALLCYIYMRRRYPLLRISFEDMLPERELSKKLLTSGISMAFMISFVQLGTLALQTSINILGEKVIVAHTAARKATGMFMLPFSVLGSALATFCGQNLGAGKPERMRQGILRTVVLTWVWCLAVILFVQGCAPSLIHGITASTDKMIIDTACRYLRFDTAFYFVPAVISLFRNSMQGYGDTKTPVFSSMLELLGKIAVVLFLTPKLGYDGIIVAEPIVWIIMVIPLIWGMLHSPAFRKEKGEKALDI